MKIFVFTTAFYPKIGGIERQTELMCREFTALGHETVVATSSSGSGDDQRFPFSVVRRPSVTHLLRLHSWCDVHLQMNISLKCAWLRLLPGAPTIYFHANTYQRDDGTPSVPDVLKCWLARRTFGVANSSFTAKSVGCSTVVFNPYDHALFRELGPRAQRTGDLVFLGRLVSQKGCDTLIQALDLLKREGRQPALTIIGDGPDRRRLEQLVAHLELQNQVQFIGTLSGEGLVQELNQHRVIVIPSRYNEAFGIVALEGLACGLLPIVSERGGLTDAVGPHGLTFLNEDAGSLARQIREVLRDPGLAERLLDGVEAHLNQFKSRQIAKRYLAVIERVVCSV